MIAVATFYYGINGAGIQRGVADYALAQTDERWRDLVAIPVPMMLSGSLPKYHVDGLIVSVWHRDVEQQIRSMRIPTVNVSGGVPNIDMPTVVVDDFQVGAAAAAYYLERGHQHFGYVASEDDRHYVAARGEGFTATIQAAGGSVSWYGTQPERLPSGATRATGDMTRWVASLPKPVALFATEDRTAAALHVAVLAARLSVPEQVSILGVDNEPNAHYMMTGISSVELPVHQIGYQAAAMLDHMMSGATPAPPLTRLPPGEVITRTSSDTRAVGDHHVLDALRFIRAGACDGIEVDDVVAKAFLSRRSLERRFRAALGTTLKDEITRVRIAYARKLLSTTNLSIDEVAQASGYHTRSQFFVAFRASTGLPPSRFRAQHPFSI